MPLFYVKKPLFYKGRFFTQHYIEDITRRREDMNFIFEWSKQYFTNERSE